MTTTPESLNDHLLPPPYEAFYREREMVILRSEFGDKKAILALQQLNDMQLRAIKSGDLKNPLDLAVVTEIWNEIIKSNPPSGRG